jgi:hypothetical protein
MTATHLTLIHTVMTSLPMVILNKVSLPNSLFQAGFVPMQVIFKSTF